MKIPIADITRQHRRLADEIEPAVLDVLRRGSYVLGPEVEAFEREMADYLGVGQAVGLASGTDALHLALRALDLAPGDEVIVPAFTFVATAEAVSLAGGTPVFADIDIESLNIDPGSAGELVSERTRAIIVVHLFGRPADVDMLALVAGPRGITLVEDCAQAAGAVLDGKKAGALAAVSAHSFFPTKNLACAGDGGMLCTDDIALASTVRMLASHGSRGDRYTHEAIGTNSRLDEIQAAILRIKLAHLDEMNEERRFAAAYYDSNLEGVVTPSARPGARHVYHQYTIRSRRRDELARWLEDAGVGCRVYYPVPLHLQPCYAEVGMPAGSLPVSERVSREVLSLPMFPGMSEEELAYVCGKVNEFTAKDA